MEILEYLDKGREKINSFGRDIFNGIYDGAGDFLADTEVSKRGLGTSLALLIGLTGCRQIPKGHEPYYSQFKHQSINEKDARHKASILEVLGRNYFLKKTAVGTGAFRLNHSGRRIDPLTGEVEFISEETRNGARGIYVLERPRIRNKYADQIDVNPEGERGKRAELSDKLKNVRGIEGELSSGTITEKNCQFNFPTVTIPPLGECYVVAEKGRPYEPFQFYMVPIEFTEIKIDKEGEIGLYNENNIWQFKFKPFTEIERIRREREREQKMREDLERKKQGPPEGTISMEDS